jgi:hypothetical protein
VVVQRCLRVRRQNNQHPDHRRPGRHERQRKAQLRLLKRPCWLLLGTRPHHSLLSAWHRVHFPQTLRHQHHQLEAAGRDTGRPQTLPETHETLPDGQRDRDPRGRPLQIQPGHQTRQFRPQQDQARGHRGVCGSPEPRVPALREQHVSLGQGRRRQVQGDDAGSKHSDRLLRPPARTREATKKFSIIEQI